MSKKIYCFQSLVKTFSFQLLFLLTSVTGTQAQDHRIMHALNGTNLIMDSKTFWSKNIDALKTLSDNYKKLSRDTEKMKGGDKNQTVRLACHRLEELISSGDIITYSLPKVAQALVVLGDFYQSPGPQKIQVAMKAMQTFYNLSAPPPNSLADQPGLFYIPNFPIESAQLLNSFLTTQKLSLLIQDLTYKNVQLFGFCDDYITGAVSDATKTQFVVDENGLPLQSWPILNPGDWDGLISLLGQTALRIQEISTHFEQHSPEESYQINFKMALFLNPREFMIEDFPLFKIHTSSIYQSNPIQPDQRDYLPFYLMDRT